MNVATIRMGGLRPIVDAPHEDGIESSTTSTDPVGLRNDRATWGPGGDRVQRAGDASRAGKTVAMHPATQSASWSQQLKGNRWSATAFRLACEWASKILPDYVRVNRKLLDKYIAAKTVLLGRFYRNPATGIGLEELRERFAPDAVLLEGEIGIGEHLTHNVQKIIGASDHILLRAEGLLETWSFSYQSELSYILSEPELMNRSQVLLEDGSRVPLERWAGEHGLLDRVGPVEN